MLCEEIFYFFFFLEHFQSLSLSNQKFNVHVQLLQLKKRGKGYTFDMEYGRHRGSVYASHPGAPGLIIGVAKIFSLELNFRLLLMWLLKFINSRTAYTVGRAKLNGCLNPYSTGLWQASTAKNY